MKNSRIVTLATFAMIVFGGVETAFADPSYSFTTIDAPVPGFTTANGINDSGQIVGIFYSARNVAHGFFLDVGGNFTTIDAPGASLTLAYGINNSGQIVGSFGGATPAPFLPTIRAPSMEGTRRKRARSAVWRSIQRSRNLA
jgi:uncharacterized membrane protein